MIKSLRLKFIQITMITVFFVLLSIILAVNIVNIYRSNQSLDSVTKILLDSGGTFHKEPENFENFKSDFIKDDFDINDRFHNKKELPFSTRFFTIKVNENGIITGSDLSNIASVSEDDLPQFAQSILKSKKAVGWISSFRYRLGHIDNNYFIIVMEATATKSSINSVFVITLLVGLIAFLTILLFVTLFSKKAIKPISETYDKQKQFITDASHELKTPLTVISANTEILSLTYGKNEWCEGINRQTASMRDLIGQMIQMSKLDENTQKMNFERFNISDAVYDTAMTFDVIAKRNSIAIEFNVVPDLFINGDEGAIRQVIAILTDNAVKYCDTNGKITISVYSIKEFGKGHIIVSIKNSFSKAESLDTEKIFERFYREEKSRSTAHSYGLGLPIARAIIDKHFGKLSAIKGDNAIEFKIDLICK